jgi:hypothetical protein
MFAEISSWTLYWITRCDWLHNGAYFLFSVMFCAVLPALGVFSFVQTDATVNAKGAKVYLHQHRWKIRTWLTGWLLSGLLVIAIPTTKEMAAIYVIPAVANNARVSKEAEEVYHLAKEYLREQVKHPEKATGEKP